MSEPSAPVAVVPKFTAYQRKLLVMLSVATFFEGYDFIALTQILPSLMRDMQLDDAATGRLVGFINVGAVLAFVVVRLADRIGRRRVMLITIAGYTLFSVLTAFTRDPYAFGAAQFLARVFLLAEYSISMVYAAEEFPAERRGLSIGLIQGFSTLGSIACAGLVPIFLRSELGWRLVYLAGAVPLILLAVLRRGLKETSRFEQRGAAIASANLWRVLAGPYRGRVLLMASIWGLTYLCTQVTVFFWKVFAVQERGLSDAQVGGAIVTAALVSAPLVFFVGKLMDKGRKRAALIIFVLTSASTVGCYTLHGLGPLTVALVFGIFGASATLPILNAYTAELFPTELRADAYAWANNLLGRIGYVLAPILVGELAGVVGFGTAVASTALFPLLALVLILTRLPETQGQELEQTSRL
jgi:putative MFS transporter